jgi:putative oxidoreductase
MSADVARRATGTVLVLVRVVAGFLFATYGGALLFLVLGEAGRVSPLAFLTWPIWWVAIIQLGGGVLVVLGIGIRVSALISSATACAFFAVQSNGLFPLPNGAETAVLLSWTFPLIALLGSAPRYERQTSVPALVPATES